MPIPTYSKPKKSLEERKFRFEKKKHRIDGYRLEYKERRDNLRAALREAHEEHRQALGMIFKTAFTNGTIFAALVLFYVTV